MRIPVTCPGKTQKIIISVLVHTPTITVHTFRPSVRTITPTVHTVIPTVRTFTLTVYTSTPTVRTNISKVCTD